VLYHYFTFAPPTFYVTPPTFYVTPPTFCVTPPTIFVTPRNIFCNLIFFCQKIKKYEKVRLHKMLAGRKKCCRVKREKCWRGYIKCWRGYKKCWRGYIKCWRSEKYFFCQNFFLSKFFFDKIFFVKNFCRRSVKNVGGAKKMLAGLQKMLAVR